jgi:hypothetical protein
LSSVYFSTCYARYVLSDGLGSIRALSDQGKTIRKRYQYEPYGETLTTGDASTNSYQYTGRENDGPYCLFLETPKVERAGMTINSPYAALHATRDAAFVPGVQLHV